MKHCLFTAALVIAACAANAAEPLRFNAIVLDVGPSPSPVVERIAALLESRLLEMPGVAVHRTIDPADPDAPRILIGVPGEHPGLAARFHRERIPSLTDLAPGPEGFLLRSLSGSSPPTLLAAGADARGVLYAVGELLRQMHHDGAAAELPPDLDLRTAPAFEVRGTEFGQSHVARNRAQVRPWTREETERAILDYALAGANVFSDNGDYFAFLDSYGLMAQGGFGANTGSGPPEWEASESIGRTGYVCLSVPEAVEAQLERFRAFTRNAPPFAFLKFHGGDGGGCECDRCKPYGLTFIHVVERMAAIWHARHPDTRIYFTNQKFDNDDDRAIFEYLQAEPRPWLWAWGYGPGSDAMSWQPGHRQTHRMDLFRYPGFGPYARYNQEILHQLPPGQTLVHYNEITHWRYSQHGYIQMYPRADRDGNLPPHWNHFLYERRPDQALTMVYDRLTFYAWPRFYHWLFGEVVRYGAGDITHSSGHHDHFNQWMWQRLLWKPRQRIEDLVAEYCRTWFGPEAAGKMAEAIFLLEEYLEEDPDTPITRKDAIDRYYALVKSAGEMMPAHRMAENWLWREFMQKGALDRYAKLAVTQQRALQERVEKRIAKTLADPEPSAVIPAIEACLGWLDALEESPEMAALREEARRLGEESDALYGVRNEGYFNLDQDFIGLGWLSRQLERAAKASGGGQRELLRMIAAYEDPGEGGHYDNFGTANHAPNLVFGYPYDHGQPYVPEMLDTANRPSQRAMHFTQDEDQGVTIEYRDLDPEAAYRIRFTFVRPWYQERYAFRMNQTKQSIFANGTLLAKDVELPLRMSDFFTYDIPQELTQSGTLIIQLEKHPETAQGDRVTVEQWRNCGGWGTLVSEAWLMKRTE